MAEILAKNTPISTVGEKAGLKPAAKNEFSGNFSYVDNFDVDNNKAGLKGVESTLDVPPRLR